jgi:hypothetical protein
MKCVCARVSVLTLLNQARRRNMRTFSRRILQRTSKKVQSPATSSFKIHGSKLIQYLRIWARENEKKKGGTKCSGLIWKAKQEARGVGPFDQYLKISMSFSIISSCMYISGEIDFTRWHNKSFCCPIFLHLHSSDMWILLKSVTWFECLDLEAADSGFCFL